MVEDAKMPPPLAATTASTTTKDSVVPTKDPTTTPVAMLKDPPPTSIVPAAVASTAAAAASSSSCVARASPTTGVIQEDVRPSTISHQEEMDRQLAEALFAEEVRQHSLSASAAFPMDDDEPPANFETLVMLEQDFLPILEIVWPEAYWPISVPDSVPEEELTSPGKEGNQLEKKKGEEELNTATVVNLEQDEHTKKPTPAVASLDPQKSTTTQSEEEESKNNNEEEEAGEAYKRYLYFQLKGMAEEMNETLTDVRTFIRIGGPLKLVEFLQSSVCEVCTMGELADTIDPDDDFDEMLASLDLWDSEGRLCMFQYMCRAIRELGADALDELLLNAKEIGYNPGQIVELIYHRVKNKSQQEEDEEAIKPAATTTDPSSSAQMKTEGQDGAKKDANHSETASTMDSADDAMICRGAKKPKLGHHQEDIDDKNDDDDGGGKMGAVRDQQPYPSSVTILS
uniref:Uncharacterized protein n=1 Tax=Amphora coffeiformis TaxID=265554 RepID=A0A7S3P5V7_9STRA